MKRPCLILLSVIATAIASVAPANACSVCRCEDPATTIAGSSMFVVRDWRVSIETEVLRKDQAAEGDPALRERETETRYTFSGIWTPRPRFGLIARVPYSARRLDAGGEIGRRAGLSDPELLVNWRALESRRGVPLWLTTQLGVRAPWGANDLARDGVRIDEHLQPGTGAAGGTAGLSLFARTGERDVAYLTTIGRWNGANRHGYRYGSAWVTTLAAQHELNGWSQAGLDLTWRDAGSDRAGGDVVGSTGGRVLYLTPRAQLRAGSRIAQTSG